MGLLVGIVGILDMRMLGVAHGNRARTARTADPWAIGGFVLNLITGFIFFAGDPFQYIHNTVFWLKLLFIVLAGVNALAFYVTGMPAGSTRSGRTNPHRRQRNSSQRPRWCCGLG